jgi:hypothetical protein
MSAKSEAMAVKPSVSVAAATGSYVINLCSSTTPMALVKPKDGVLAQYTFFISRRREDGRERFRLHMGYFPSLETAEKLLGTVREVYPSAWAGEAPGKKLRPQSAPQPAGSPANATHANAERAVLTPRQATVPAPASVAATPAPRVNALPTPTVTPRIAAGTAAEVPPVPMAPPRPVLRKAAVAATNAAIPTLARAPQKPASRLTPAPAVARPALPNKSAAPGESPRAANDGPARAASATNTAVTPPPNKQATGVAAKSNAMPTVERANKTPESNIREVLAELDELSDTQALTMLEKRSRSEPKLPEAAVHQETIKLVKPDDTQTMRSIKQDVQRNAPVLFAVQLDWSVTPFDLSKVPALAIFNAYTLYTTEAHRDGRAWYGLRLGFFSDANSAKQVAYYVRSDFAAVAVVPVTTVEKDKATAHQAKNLASTAAPTATASSNLASAQAAPAPNKTGEIGGFSLLEDDTPPPIEIDVVGEASPRLAPAKPAALSVAEKIAESRKADKGAQAQAKERPGRRAARAKTRPETLDETLEILGATDLQIDTGRGELLNDSGVRHLRVSVDKRTRRFSSLLERLSAKLGR